MVARGARVGDFARNATEADAITAVIGLHILARFGCGDTHIVYLAGQHHLIQGLLDFARVIELEHHCRVGFVVVAVAIEAAAEKDIVV